MKFSLVAPALVAGVLATGLASCGGGGGANPNTNPPVVPNIPLTYNTTQTIALPGVPTTSGPAFSFDIGFIDPVARQYYLADRTNKGVDVIDTRTNTFVRVAGAGSFAGVAPPGTTAGGPNGIVSVGNGIIFAGDGDSTMKVVNANTGALLATIPVPNPYVGPNLPATCGTPGVPTIGAANQRVDEMAYDPTDNVVLAINDASCPPFGTFFNASPPYNIIGSVTFPTANKGAEQPTWDPTQRKFIMALPATIANPGGEVDLIDPKSFAITSTFGVTNCSPAGTALGKNETLFLGCQGPQILTINATNGQVINAITSIGGADMVGYNPTTDRFYGALSNNLTGPIFLVANGSGLQLNTIATSAGAHSIAVDPNTDSVYIPQRSKGVTVFAHP